METRFGKNIDLFHPLFIHPNPYLWRDDFIILNGPWRFGIKKEGEEVILDRTIVVPFSIETPLSGICENISKGDTLIYEREFELPASFLSKRIHLHFDAVDQIADIYLNGENIGHHEGGYLPFSIELLGLKKGLNRVRVEVKDDTDSEVFSRGKQSNKPSGIWYHPTSGIWGSVWIEATPETYIASLKIIPDFDKKGFDLQIFSENPVQKATLYISYENQLLIASSFDPSKKTFFDLSNDFHPWSPEEPNLYQLKIVYGEDSVHSTVGLRKFSSIPSKGHKVFGLNNKPYFLKGVLDQGYYPESGLTPPSLEAMANDILTMKKMGFNMLRKHIKVETLNWYYLCDVLGMIVLQDFVNGGSRYSPFMILTAPFARWYLNDSKKASHRLLGRKSLQSRHFFEKEYPALMSHLFNVTSIAVWTIFNEGWGQFDSLRIAKDVRERDSSRLIDSASGWFDQGGGDFCSRHIYFRAPKAKSDGKRILSLSEYGGFVKPIKGHRSGSGKGVFYQNAKGELTLKYKNLMEKYLLPSIEKEGLSVAVYTQLSDVEEEENGLLTYDREVVKIDIQEMKMINEKARFVDDD